MRRFLESRVHFCYYTLSSSLKQIYLQGKFTFLQIISVLPREVVVWGLSWHMSRVTCSCLSCATEHSNIFCVRMIKKRTFSSLCQ